MQYGTSKKISCENVYPTAFGVDLSGEIILECDLNGHFTKRDSQMCTQRDCNTSLTLQQTFFL